LTSWRNFRQTARRYTDSNQAEDNAPLGSSSLPDPQFQRSNFAEKMKERRTMKRLNQLNKATVVSLIVVLIICLGPPQNAPAQACPSNCNGGITALGVGALDENTGGANTAIGGFALSFNTAGEFNTATGWSALLYNTTGSRNTAMGATALYRNTTGSHNTATGEFALFDNTTGSFNTANGALALESNGGSNNTAIGASSLQNNTTGNFNMASGFQALHQNTTGELNTANGGNALEKNTTGNSNTANGAGALPRNTTGVDNTASGVAALYFNTTGFTNTANGVGALVNNTTGSGNVALGFLAGKNATTGSGNVYIGTEILGVAGESNACYIASVFGQTSVSGVPVLINSDNKLGTATSSARFKRDIHDMDKSSEALFALKPVTFRYKKELDPQGIQQWGLVAEEVGKVNPDLIVRDKEGKPYSVRYDQVNAMLLNEFLKEHKKVEEQQATIEQLKSSAARQEAINAQQQKGMEALVATVEEQAALIQKVSAQLEVNKAAPQTVLNKLNENTN
jgi:hypothetical protein